MIGEDRRDYYAGGLAIFMGLGIIVIAQQYAIGSLTKMGPGFFPVVLGSLLAFVGVLIVVSAMATSAGQQAPADKPHSNVARPDWRGWGCIVGSVLTFIAVSGNAGLAPATFLAVFIACWSDKTATLKSSILLAAGVTAFGVGLFSYILHVPIPIIGGM